MFNLMDGGEYVMEAVQTHVLTRDEIERNRHDEEQSSTVVCGNNTNYFHNIMRNSICMNQFVR